MHLVQFWKETFSEKCCSAELGSQHANRQPRPHSAALFCCFFILKTRVELNEFMHAIVNVPPLRPPHTHPSHKPAEYRKLDLLIREGDQHNFSENIAVRPEEPVIVPRSPGAKVAEEHNKTKETNNNKSEVGWIHFLKPELQ